MQQFSPNTIVTIPGLYLLKGEPPFKTVLAGGQFIEQCDHSKAEQRTRRFEVGEVLPDLGYKNQMWFLIPNQ